MQMHDDFKSRIPYLILRMLSVCLNGVKFTSMVACSGKTQSEKTGGFKYYRVQMLTRG